MQLKKYIQSLLILSTLKYFLPIVSTLFLYKNTECQEERFGLKRVNWPEETLYPKSNALTLFAARRAPVRGEKYSTWKIHEQIGMRYKQVLEQILEQLPIEIFPIKYCFILRYKCWLLSLSFAHGIPIGNKHARIVQLRAQIKMLCDLQRNNVKCTTKAAALRVRVGQAASPWEITVEMGGKLF